jgi:calcineurin-like phosphoesterase family protein
MDTYLIDTWNSIVGDDDVVKVVGDFAMGPAATDGFIAGKLGLLNGEIHIVPGNHDQPVPKFGQSGIKKIVEDFDLGSKVKVMPDLHSFQVDGVWFDACHYEMKTWPHERRNGIHLYGHYHTELKDVDILRSRRGRSYEVGSDIYGGPVELTGDLRYLNKPGGWKV